MNWHRFTVTAKTWINPPFPGRGKNPLLGFVVGLLLGPMGVGLYLRSVVDGVLSVFALYAVLLLVGGSPPMELVCNVLAGLWVVGRIHLDNHRSRSALGLGDPAPSAGTPVCG